MKDVADHARDVLRRIGEAPVGLLRGVLARARGDAAVREPAASALGGLRDSRTVGALAAAFAIALLWSSCAGPPPFPVEGQPVWRVAPDCERELVLRVTRGPDRAQTPEWNPTAGRMEVRVGRLRETFWESKETLELAVDDPPLAGGTVRVRVNRGEESGTLKVVVPPAPAAVRLEVGPLPAGDDVRGSLNVTYPGLEPTTSSWSGGLDDSGRLELTLGGCGVAAAGGEGGDPAAGVPRFTAALGEAIIVPDSIFWYRDPPPLVRLATRARLEQTIEVPLAGGEPAQAAVEAEVAIMPWLERIRGQDAAGLAPYRAGEPAPLVALFAPEDLRGSAGGGRLGDLVLLATVQARRTRLADCGPYYGEGLSDAYYEHHRAFGDVEVVELASDRVIARRTFSEEGECPWEFQHLVGAKTSFGGSLPEDEVVEWLAAVARGGEALAPYRLR